MRNLPPPSSEPQEVASRITSVAPRLCENAKNRASTRFAGSEAKESGFTMHSSQFWGLRSLVLSISKNGGDSTTPRTWNLSSLDPVAGQDFEVWLSRMELHHV